LVLGSQYTGAGMLFRWLMLTIVAGPLASYMGSQLIPAGREKKYLVAVMTGAAANVVLNIFLIPRYGAIAAAFTTAVSQAAVAVMNYYYSRDLSRPSLFSSLALSGIASAVMAAAVILVRSTFAWNAIIFVALGALIYGAVYWLAYTLWTRLQKPSVYSQVDAG
jgi:O-antigen/teichoic acid export membrane protein